MYQRLCLYLSALLALSGCQLDVAEKTPDVSNIQINLDINRFEQALFDLDTTNWETELLTLEQAQPIFSDLYFSRILNSKQLGDQHPTYVKGFVQHPAVRQLYDTTQIVFKNLQPIKEEVTQLLQYYRYYFPQDSVDGQLTTFISEYTIGAFLYENNKIGLGLDFFLGADYPYQKYNPNNPSFSQYITQSFTKAHITEKIGRLLLEDKLGFPKGNRLLDQMIHNGKKLYMLDRLLPSAPDSIILEVTGTQAEWLNNNERNMWSFFLEEDLLYSSDFQDIRKYVEYSPHSPGMPDEAPGRTGNWLGWQVVEAYMKRHPELSLNDLIAINDAQMILDDARYKPRR
ncbi:MAG: hypothetical protein AAF798_11835 [Bacteroidota bacterium]